MVQEIQYSSSIIEIIRKRKSCRSYRPVPIAKEIKKILEKMFSEQLYSPFRGNVRFKLIERQESDTREKKRLGTYGIIHGAIYFLVGGMRKSKYDFEDFGFKMEQLILLATDMELGTCWVGGTLKRNEFAAQINTRDDEIVPSISPIGYPAPNTLIGKLAKRIAKSKDRFPWPTLFFENNIKTPLLKERAKNYALPLEMVRIAPSASNRQPWRIIKVESKNIFHFYIFRKKKKGIYQRIFQLDFPRIDIGIAASHFDLVNREIGLEGKWEFIHPNLKVPEEFQYVISWIGQ